MTILNIAEKPSVAKSISRILSTHCETRRGLNQYCTNIYFTAEADGRKKDMIFTSVLGHIFNLEFVEQGGDWKASDPRELFEAEIRNSIPESNKLVVKNIINLCKNVEKVVIWTDCDREGENIGMSIKNIIRNHSNVDVKRARFSGISRNEIEYALANLTEINYNEAEAVECRKELDLRIGSAFTRIQSVAYNKNKFIISFGPCQIPTLNFVVQRHFLIEKFVPETFYSLNNKIENDNFLWLRHNIFDKNCVAHFYNSLKDGVARILSKKTEEKLKYRPLPLRTVEFQKACSSYYKIDGHRIMEIAEKLYTKGYISYPRTETDAFPKNFGFKNIIKKLESDSFIGEYASNFTFKYPRSGSNNDQAHSPIYPLKDGNDLGGDERKIFDYISRWFLACISEDAKGLQTEVLMEISKGRIRERFICTGIKVLEKNYLSIYFYDKWEGNSIGEYKEGQKVANNLVLKEGKTTCPEYLSESDLISLMDKNGIGTDATIHEHIHKIQLRRYAIKAGFRIKPLQLGINLINSYKVINLPIYEPEIRKSMEGNLKLICMGKKTRQSVLNNEIRIYKTIYDKLSSCIDTFKDVMHSVELETPSDSFSTDGSKPFKKDYKENKKAKTVGIGEAHTKDDITFLNEYNKNRSKAKELQQEPKGLQQNQVLKNCSCKEEAKLLEVKKGQNIGKFYYSCHFFPKKCSFFEWKDVESKKLGKRESIEPMKCHCGYECIRKVANTEANKGRAFFACKKMYKKCKYFVWEDEQ